MICLDGPLAAAVEDAAVLLRRLRQRRETVSSQGRRGQVSAEPFAAVAGSNLQVLLQFILLLRWLVSEARRRLRWVQVAMGRAIRVFEFKRSLRRLELDLARVRYHWHVSVRH